MNNKQVYDYAIKWLKIFKDEKSDFKQLMLKQFSEETNQLDFKEQNPDFNQFIENQFISDCLELGFENRYDQTLDPYEILDEDFSRVYLYFYDNENIQLLTYLIYAKTRYYNQFTNEKKDELEANYRTWFNNALNRLALLTLDSPYLFQGVLSEINIYSNSVVFGPMPQPDDEVYQQIIIHNNGNVNFIGYTFENSNDNKRIIDFNITYEDKDLLFTAFKHIFSNYHEWFDITCSGDWTLKLTNTDGITFEFNDALVAKFYYEGIDLSDLVRQVLAMDDLFVFDGDAKEDPINKIIIDYYKMKVDNLEDDLNNNIYYSERLVIDRESKTLIYNQNSLNNYQISKEYFIENNIDNLIDNFEDLHIFWHEDEENNESLSNTPYYTITVYFERRKPRVLKGRYDKEGLPYSFELFIKPITNFLNNLNFGEIFNSNIYGKEKNSEYHIYCSVVFDGSNKSYYYLCDDKTVEIGDFVVVPVGVNNELKAVEVVNIEYYNKENVPYSLASIKKIIRKCTEEDIDILMSPRINLS